MRRFRPLLAAATLAATLGSADGQAQTLFGESWPQVGGWGNAWGDDVEVALPAPAATEAPPPIPAAQPVAVIGQAGTPPARSPTAPAQAPLPQPVAEAAPAFADPSAAPPADQPTDQPAEPVQLTADQVIHDRELGIVSAIGRVEINHGNRSLIADNVSYNLKEDMISASGNVTLIEPTGDVLFSDYFELTGDFKNGTAREIRVLLADRSRMAAASAQRVGGDRTDFEKAVYTACEPCRDDPSRTPIWQAKAERVTHNQLEQTIEYRDAWIEIKGVPVIYTPYLSHPDPTVKRKSGFLVPTASLNSTLGPNLTTPYFWAIRDNEDLTFSPRFLFSRTALTSSTASSQIDEVDNNVLQKVVLAGEHRWLGASGETKTGASLTADKYTGKYRGHLDARGRFDITKATRAGYQVERTSDDTYTALYGYLLGNERPWYTTRPYVESFGRRSYAMAEAYSFQGSRETDDPGLSPLVLPHAVYNYVGDPGRLGGQFFGNSSLLAYTRAEGTDAARLSTSAGWRRPFTSNAGDLWQMTTSVRADGYRSQDLDQSPALSSTDGSGFAGRVVPQASLDWRHPFVRPGAIGVQSLEPRAMFAVSPLGGNPSDIPNEDSIDFELDEINVLTPNRLPGLDRVEGGPRGGYGLKWSLYPQRGGRVSGQVAQGWRARKYLAEFPAGSGFDGQLSDLVGRVEAAPSGTVSFLNRFRLDKDTFEARRNETSLSFGPQALNVGLAYLFIDHPTEGGNSLFSRRHNLAYRFSSAISENWSLAASASHDLTDAGGPLGYNARLTYADECFAFVGNLRRFYTSDRDLLAGYDFTFNLILKTLGDVPITAW